MKVLYFGGQKSGKSSLAERKTLSLSAKTPYYIATYDHSYDDSEMQSRITRHQQSRLDTFISIEETHDLISVIKPGYTYLIDCMSMWLLNRLSDDETSLLRAVEALEGIDANIVFVLNDVSSGVIPLESISRKFVDLSGLIGQKLASLCDEVYEVKLGLEIRLK